MSEKGMKFSGTAMPSWLSAESLRTSSKPSAKVCTGFVIFRTDESDVIEHVVKGAVSSTSVDNEGGCLRTLAPVTSS